jgi:hypothetical protein
LLCAVHGIAVLFLSFALPAVAADSEVQAVIDALARQEARLVNLHVEGEAWFYEKKAADSDWKKTPIHAVSKWSLNGRPGSKARVDVEEVLAWKGGTSPNTYHSLSSAYDGMYGTEALHRTGPPERIREVKLGQVFGERPASLIGSLQAYAGGLPFNAYFYDMDKGLTLSESFQSAIGRGIAVHCEQRRLDGQEVIVLTIGSGDPWHEEWVLDPGRGYGLLQYRLERADRSGALKLKREIRVDELSELSDGVWYPTSAYKSELINDEVGWHKYEYRCSVVSANAPDFDEAIFKVEFPAGYMIVDHVSGMKYRMGFNDEETAARLDQLVSDVQQGGDIHTAVGDAHAGQGDVDAEPVGGSSQFGTITRSKRNVWLVVVPILFAVGAGIGLVRWRGRKAGKSA